MFVLFQKYDAISSNNLTLFTNASCPVFQECVRSFNYTLLEFGAKRKLYSSINITKCAVLPNLTVHQADLSPAFQLQLKDTIEKNNQ